MSTGPVTVIEYLEPVLEAEALPEEFSPSSMRRSLLILGAIVLAVVALIVLVPGLSSLRDRFAGAQPEWIAVAALLQLGSCAGYVLVFRGVFCRRMSWRTSTEIGLSELAANSVLSIGGAGGLALGAWVLRRGGLPTPFIARRTVAFFLLTSPPHRTLLPADEPRQRHLPHDRRRGPRHRPAQRLAGRGVRARARARGGGCDHARP